jgi:VanZ family protein
VNAARPSRWGAAWTQWYRMALPAYWISLFALTHFPKLEFNAPISAPDKYAHIGAFGLLAFLFWRFVETIRRPLSGRFVWFAAIWLIGYAAFDEYLQQFVGRTTDLGDWLCDAAGMAVVLAVLEWRRRAHRAGVESRAV